MRDIWDRIEPWLQANASERFATLQRGATTQKIRATERQLGVSFPPDVEESYRIHDGQTDLGPPLIEEWHLLPLSAVVKEWKLMRKLLTAGKLDGGVVRPVGPVKAQWWSEKWIPIASNGGGDFRCLDFDPARGGNVGQVISFWHMDDKRERIAPSFRGWLAAYAKDLK